MATQAAACPSGGDGSRGGGTPKLILLSMEWRHTTKVQVELCEPPCLQRKFLSSARVYWLLYHADTGFFWSYRHRLWKDCVKTYCYFGGVLKSKWFCWTSLQHDATDACVVTMTVAVNHSLSIGMNLSIIGKGGPWTSYISFAIRQNLRRLQWAS